MIENVSLFNTLFFDIETAPLAPSFSDLDEEMQKLWQYRIRRFKPEDISDEDYYFEKAGVYAEFAKVICISVGIFRYIEDELTFRINSYYGNDEKDVLRPFIGMLEDFFNNPFYYKLCGHNIKEFDVPFLSRRAIINKINIPNILDVSALKPWELPFVDTMQLWKFGDYRNYTSLHLLTHALGIPSPKSDMEGKDVARVYWTEEGGLERIRHYCERDVLAIARLIQRFKGKDMIPDESVLYVTKQIDTEEEE